jgi:hypothetical protein
VLLVSMALASPPERAPQQASRAWVAGGWDPTWVVELGAGHTVWRETLEAYALLKAPLVLAPAGGLEAGLGLDVQPDLGAWRVASGLDVRVAFAASELGRQLGYGLDLWVRPGRALGPVVLAAELGLRQGLATRVWHSEAAQAMGGVRDGWLAAPVRRLRVGGLAAWQLSEPVALGVSGGFESTPGALGIPANPSLGQLPFTFTASVEVRWPRD